MTEYQRGLADAAKIARKFGGILALAEGHDDDEARADRWYAGGQSAAKSIAAEIEAAASAPAPSDQ